MGNLHRLVPILALLVLAGCGGGTTTVINKTVTRSSDPGTTSSTTAANTPPGETGSQTCGTLPPNFQGGPRQTVYAAKLDCATARRLAKQASAGAGLPSSWGCAASTLACQNSVTGASFRVDDNTPPGEQYCPKGLIAVGDNACGPPPAKSCSPDVVQKATPDQVAALGVKAQNVDCGSAVKVVRQAAACQTICPGPFSGLTCHGGATGAVCKGSAYRKVTFSVAYYGD